MSHSIENIEKILHFGQGVHDELIFKALGVGVSRVGICRGGSGPFDLLFRENSLL
jgi:hypothetical protein